MTSNNLNKASNDLKETTKESIEPNRKSKLKGGYPYDNNRSSERNLIGQVFS